MSWQKNRFCDPVELRVELDGTYTVMDVLGEIMTYAPPPKRYIPPPPKRKVELKVERCDPRETRYCRECGAYIPMGETVCLACGLDQEKRPVIRPIERIDDGDLLLTEGLHSGVIGVQRINVSAIDEMPFLDMNELAGGCLMKVRLGGETMIAHVCTSAERYAPGLRGERRFILELTVEEA